MPEDFRHWQTDCDCSKYHDDGCGNPIGNPKGRHVGPAGAQEQYRDREERWKRSHWVRVFSICNCSRFLAATLLKLGLVSIARLRNPSALRMSPFCRAM